MVSIVNFVVPTRGVTLKWKSDPEPNCSNCGSSGAHLKCLERDRQVCLIVSPYISYALSEPPPPRDEIGLHFPCIRTAWASFATSKSRRPRKPNSEHGPYNITVTTDHGRKGQRRTLSCFLQPRKTIYCEPPIITRGHKPLQYHFQEYIAHPSTAREFIRLE